MHFHAEHSLFFERRQPLWRAALCTGVTLSMLIINAGASSATLSLTGAGIGSALLIAAYVGGHRRIEPVIAWTVVLVLGALLGGVALRADINRFVDVASRVLCGVVWVLWLGTQVDWASLRALLLAIRAPKTIVSTLDHAVLHGVLTQREWICRRNAARLRTGSPKVPLASLGQLLGEGAVHAFFRLERVEENALIRSISLSKTDGDLPLTLTKVSVKRGEQTVLRDLELRIQSPQWLLVCGASGAGKSSLLRLLAGLDAPTDGSMTRLGEQVVASSSLRNRLDGRVALLVQNPEHHFIASTVEEDIEWGLRRRGVPAEDAKAQSQQMAHDLGIGHLLSRACHDLSFGEQRRVALAGLLVLKPKILLLDEPTSGLDPVAAHHLRRLVRQWVERTDATCIWATHDLHSAPSLAARTLLLKEGRIIFDGPTDEGLSRPWMLQAGLAVSEGVQD